MPIVDGKYGAKVSTTYATPAEGIAEIKKRIAESKRVRISNVPMSLVEELLPLLEDKDVKFILAKDDKVTEELKELGDVAIQKAKLYKDHKGVKANLDSIFFSDIIFSIAWKKKEISFI